MKPSDNRDFEQLALVAELARPLAHECNNFLNNLFLQMAIWGDNLPEPVRSEMTSIRQEGKKLARLLQEWQQYRAIASRQPLTIDVNEVIRDFAQNIQTEESSVRVRLALATEPACLTGYAREIKLLCRLLLRYVISAVNANEKISPGLEVQTGKTRGKVLLRFVEADPAFHLEWRDFDDSRINHPPFASLTVAACKSIVERLQGSLHVEKRGENAYALVMEFPADAS